MTAAEQLADELDRVLVRPVREAADDETADALAALFDPAAMLGDPGRVLAIIGQHARPAEWWGTPLGRLCAPHSDATVTHAEAAALLGVARGRISSLLADGHLDRRGGRVTVASVAARLDRLSPDRPFGLAAASTRQTMRLLRREQPGRNLQSRVARCHPSRYDGHISKEAPPEQQLRRGQQPGKDPDQ